MDDLVASPASLNDLLSALTREVALGDRQTDAWKAAVVQFSNHALERRAEFLAVFGGREPTVSEFFQRLRDTANESYASDECARLLGTLWTLALHGKCSDELAAFLDGWFAADWHFFGWLRAVPTLVETTQIPAGIAGPWLRRVFQKVRNDLANGPFFSALERYAQKWPEEALLVLERRRDAVLDDGQVTILGNLLANLHGTVLTPHQTERVALIESVLSKSREVSQRETLHLARRCRLGAGNSTQEDAAAWFDDLAHEVSELRVEGFKLAKVAAHHAARDAVSLSHAFFWVERHTSAPLSDVEKLHLLNFVSTLLAPEDGQRRIDGARLHELLHKVLPLPKDESGLWRSLDSFLRSIISRAPAEIGTILRTLVSDGKARLVEQLRRHDEITCLRDSLHTPDGITLIGDFCFSGNENERELGLALFEKTGFTEFPAAKIAALDERAVLLALFQFQRMPFVTEVVSRFLLALLPRVQTCSEQVQDAFYDELLFQAKNLPKACLALLRQHPNPTPNLRAVIEDADGYFERLKGCAESPITQMAVPGLRSARRIQARRFNQSMTEGFRRGSSLLEFFHNVRVIYGMSFSSYREGAVTDSTPMQEVRHEMEMPRLLLLDPEGMALRRLRASALIQQLNTRSEDTE